MNPRTEPVPLRSLRLLNSDVVTQLLDLDTARVSQQTAFVALASGEAWQPDKIGGGHQSDTSTLFCYAARLNRATGPASKFGSLNPDNGEHGLASIHATITLLDPDTGVPVAIIDGTPITSIRTAAASAVALQTLANPDAEVVAVLGAGEQARAHVRAIAAALPVGRFYMWAPDRDALQQTVEGLQVEGYPVVAADGRDQSLGNADIVICATTSLTPLFPSEVLKVGVTVVSVGSFEAHRSELGPDVISRCDLVVVDHLATAQAHAGPLIDLDTASLGRPIAELGRILHGTADGRRSAEDVIGYLSVGLGVQDAAAAWSVYETAVQQDLGVLVPWA